MFVFQKIWRICFLKTPVLRSVLCPITNEYVNVTVFSSSGDTNIIVLLLAFLQDHKEQISITDGHGEKKKF